MTPKIKGCTRDFITEVASNPEMRARYGPLPGASKGHVRNAVLFAILTANERYTAAEDALAMLQQLPTLHNMSTEAIAILLRGAGIVYYNNKAVACQEFSARFFDNPTPFHPLPEEDNAQYRDRLHSLKVRGLGWIKASFAAYLAYGGGNVICTDRHILGIYYGEPFGGSHPIFKNTKRAQEMRGECENFFVWAALTYDWPSASALQWAVWCEAIGSYTDHAVVRNGGPDN